MDRATPARAFSLIELVVVTVVLAIVAGTIALRFVDTSSRRAEQTVLAMRELISAAAMRQELTAQPVQLEFAGSRLSLRAVRAAGALATTRMEREWGPDPLASPVEAEGVVIKGVLADATRLDPESWRIDLSSFDRRPAVAILVETIDGAEAWRLELRPDESRASVFRVEPAGPFNPATGDVVDLDAIGLGEEAW